MARAFIRNTAQPTSISVMPKYIGFRVRRYTPDTTNAELVPGVIGLTVVRARRNEMPLAKMAETPRDAGIAPTNVRIDGIKLSDGTTCVPVHIISATRSATTAGGIFNSRAFIVNSYDHNV